MKIKLNIKRFYVGKEKGKKLPIVPELVTTNQLPIIDELVKKNNGIFSDVKHREDLMTYWKNARKTTINNQVVKPHSVLLEQENIQEEKQEEKIQEQKQLPKIAQLVIKTGIESILEKKNTNEKKQEQQQIQDQDHKNFMIETAIKVAQGVYNAQGWPALVIGLVQVLIKTPGITQTLAINKGFMDWGRFLIKNPWNKVMNFFRWNKYKITSGSLGTGAGLDLINELNVQGADIIKVNGKHYIVNQNIKEHIVQQINILENKGVQVTDVITENMIVQGKGVLLSKNTLEPMIKSMPWEKKDEIMELNIFSNDVASNFYNYENVPSIVSNPIDAIKNINDYTDIIITAAGGNDGFNIFGMVIAAVLFVGSIFLGVKAWNHFQQVEKNGLNFIPVNNNRNGFDFFTMLSNYKNNIFYGALGLFGLGSFLGINKKKEQEKKEEEDDDSDLC